MKIRVKIIHTQYVVPVVFAPAGVLSALKAGLEEV